MSIRRDIDEAVYHKMGGLSSTGAKQILHCPAKFAHDRENPPRKKAWDIGSVAHRLILGKGVDFAVVEGNRNAKATKEAIAAQEADGKVVLKLAEMEAAEGMAAAVRNKTSAARFLATGEAELSIFADVDEVPIRGRVDWLTHHSDGTPFAVDVKTASVDLHSDREVARTIAKFGYHIQAAHYLRILAANDMQAEWAWIFATTSKPHCVRVIQPSQDMLARGAELDDQAVATFKSCSEADEWPCTCEQFTTIDLPTWSN